MGPGASAPAAPAAGGTRRFVFEMSEPGVEDSVWHKSIREVRAADEAEATAEICTWWVVAHGGVRFRIVGERISIGKAQRFLPLVEDDKIPDEIVRNERVIGLDKAVA